ncbi:hypothetical protein SteCoe_6032 [Stentor coeruleus]|uniref:Uncharacterized protein n=1 Tax=Stentor coeruleus TaxID=5963 RepID=A0A1R2CR21_9CILI|nr:hypothetical protein SteCoe_6032 [Stentor coeruleus]
MDEKDIVQSILKQVGIKYSENEQSLQEDIKKSSSNLIIRIKNLLDHNKSSFHEDSYIKYSHFLTETLNIKRRVLENKALLCCGDFFNKEILPCPTKNIKKVSHGIGLWGLHMKQKTKDTRLPNNTKYLYAIICKITVKILCFSFSKIKDHRARIELGRIKIKNLLLKKILKSQTGIRKKFLKFSDACKKKTMSIKIAEEMRRKQRNSAKKLEGVRKSEYSLKNYIIIFITLYVILSFYLG